MRKFVTSTLVSALVLGSASFAVAQATPSIDSVVAACSGGDCQQQIQDLAAAAAASGATPAQVDALLIQVVTALQAANAPAQRVAAAAAAAANAATSQQAREGLTQVAEANAANGNGDLDGTGASGA